MACNFITWAATNSHSLQKKRLNLRFFQLSNHTFYFDSRHWLQKDAEKAFLREIQHEKSLLFLKNLPADLWFHFLPKIQESRICRVSPARSVLWMKRSQPVKSLNNCEIYPDAWLGRQEEEDKRSGTKQYFCLFGKIILYFLPLLNFAWINREYHHRFRCNTCFCCAYFP